MTRLPLALLAAVLLVPAARATTETTNYSDLWWTPAESGWGVTVTQEKTTLFLTFFVYGTESRPTWVTGTLAKTGQAASGLPVFGGDLVATTGPFYGSSFDPGQVTRRIAGSATFAPTGATTARLDYVVDGVPVTKSIRRQTLANENLSGTYAMLGDFTIRCTGMSPDSGLIPLMVMIVHDGTSLRWRHYDPEAPSDYCEAAGTSVQEGQLMRASGTMSCTSASGTATLAVSEVTSTPFGLTGRYALSEEEAGIYCEIAGPFTALRQ